MRLFAALRPSAAAHAHLDRALEPFRISAGPTLRWTDPDNWHITLAFYGEQPDGDLDAICDMLDDVAARHDRLDLHLSGAGSFSGSRLWIGVGGDTDPLRALMADCLLDPELRHRQRAHLTVGRVAATGRRERHSRRSSSSERNRRQAALPGGPSIEDVVRALSVYSGPDFRAGSIELVRSTLGAGRSGGSLYETVARFPLGGGCPDQPG